MSAVQSVTFTLQAVDNMSNVIQNVSNKVDSLGGVAEKVGGKLDFLKDALKTAAGVMLRDFMNTVTRSIGESVKLGASVVTLKNSFDKLKKANNATNLSLDSLRKATKNTVSDVDLLTSSNKALQLGVPADELNSLYAAAMRLGPAMGLTTAQAVDRLSVGIGRMSKLIMDDVGITFDATEAQEWYAAQLGITTSQLDESQKTLAWQNYAMAQVSEKGEELGDVMSDAQLQQEQFAAATENAKTAVGEAIGPFGSLVTAIEPLMPMLGTMTATALPSLIKQVPKLIEPLNKMGIGWKSAAVGVGGFFLGLAGGLSLLKALPDDIRNVAAALMAGIGAIVAATVAWLALHGTMTLGVAVPIILTAVGAGIAGLMTLLTPHLVGLAEGGIVTKPTVALVGEKGPEAIIPLTRRVVPTLNEVNITNYFGGISNEVDLEDAGEIMYKRFFEKVGNKW